MKKRENSEYYLPRFFFSSPLYREADDVKDVSKGRACMENILSWRENPRTPLYGEKAHECDALTPEPNSGATWTGVSPILFTLTSISAWLLTIDLTLPQLGLLPPISGQVDLGSRLVLWEGFDVNWVEEGSETMGP